MAASVRAESRAEDWSNEIGSRLSRLTVFLAVGGVAALLGLASIKLTREPGALAVLWMPNAFVVGVFWARRQNLSDLVLAAVLGITLANVIHGDSWLVGGLLGAANGLEVIVACLCVARVLHFAPAHASYVSYLSFLAAVCLLPAFVAGALGATVVSLAYEAAWTDVFVGWALGGFTSMMALAPLSRLVLVSTEIRHAPQLNEVWKFIVCFACLVASFAVFGAVLEGTTPLIVSGPVLSVFALWLAVGTVVAVTAGLLMMVTLIAFFDPALFSAALGFASSPSAFVLTFGCLVIPGNLIASVVAALRGAEREAHELSRLKSEFLATMSHEIRTPLNAILGMFQLLRLASLPEKQLVQAKVGEQAAERLLKQLTDVLELSRLDAKAVELLPDNAEIEELSEKWRAMAEAALQRHGKALDLIVEKAADLPSSLWVDEERLSQIVQNLIDNAVRFTEQGAITLGISLDDAGTAGRSKVLEIRVADTGCGIPAEQLSLVFERFRQVDGSMKRKVGGTGLGLAISTDLARLMGGTITVDSAVGLGSTFKLNIPLRKIQKARNL